MTAPVIPTLPTAPSRSNDPDTFVARADAHVAALTPWTTAANSLGTYLDALGTAADADATTATTQAGIATAQATLAQDWATKTSGTVDGSEYSAKKYAQDASASASTAISSPGTQATSTSSLTVGTGSKAFTLAQTGKNFVVGQWVTISRTSAPTTTYMVGAITSFTSGTGDITVNVATINGSGGPFTDWSVIQGSPIYKYGLTSIGSIRFDIEKGTTVSPTTDDISTYLRSGTTATAATYPLAAGKGIDCYGTTTGGIAGSYIGDIAHDGANTLVATTDAANSVLVSTDGGATWTPTAVGLSAKNICAVGRVGGRFIVVGYAGNTIYLSWSTNGTSWTAGATVAYAAGGNKIAVACDSSIMMIAVNDATSASVFTTADGTSITTRTIPAVIGGSLTPRIACMPSLGANRWLIGDYNWSTLYRSTAADGSAWSAAQTAPAQPNGSLIATNDKFIICNGGTLYYSSTGLTGSWTTVTIPSGASSAYGGRTDQGTAKCQTYFDGTRLWIGAAMPASAVAFASHAIYTTDLTTFSTWTPVQVYQTFLSKASSGAAIGPVVCGTNLIFVKLDGTISGFGQGNSSTSMPTYVHQANWTSGPARVGLTVPLMLEPSTATYITEKYVGYVRVA